MGVGGACCVPVSISFLVPWGEAMLIVVDVVVEESAGDGLGGRKRCLYEKKRGAPEVGCRKGPTSRDDMQFITPFSCPSFAV